jgi:hypothetical protein
MFDARLKPTIGYRMFEIVREPICSIMRSNNDIPWHRANYRTESSRITDSLWTVFISEGRLICGFAQPSQHGYVYYYHFDKAQTNIFVIMWPFCTVPWHFSVLQFCTNCIIGSTNELVRLAVPSVILCTMFGITHDYLEYWNFAVICSLLCWSLFSELLSVSGWLTCCVLQP